MYSCIKSFMDNDKENGLLLLDMPTGFGKTYSVNQTKKTESIRRIEKIYDYHKTEAKLLQSEVLLNKLKVKNLTVTLILIISVVVIVVISVLGYVQMKKKK